MAFPSVAGTAALTQVESADPTAINMPSSIQSGELLIVVCSGDTGGVFTQSGGTDWTRLINTNQSTNIGGAVFAKIAAGSDTLSIQFEQNDLAAVAFRVTGHGVSDVATDITIASAIGADISPNPPNCNPGVSADYLWIEGFAADDDDETATFQTSGWTQIAQAESAQTVGSCMVAVAYLQATASSQDPGLMTLAEAEQWVAFTLAVPPAAGGAITETVNGVTETDTAQALTSTKAKSVAQVPETNTAQPIASAKVVLLGQVIETSTAQSIAWAPKNRLISQTVETDTAQSTTTLKTVTVDQVIETDTAQPVTEPAGQTITVNQVVETDAAQILSSLKSVQVGLVTETDTAQVLVAVKTLIVGQTLETDISQPIAVSGQKIIAVNQVNETDTAQLVTWAPKHRLVSLITETDVAQSIVSVKTVAIGQASETDTAQLVASGGKLVNVGLVTETDLAQSISWSPKHRLVSQVIEVDLPQPLTSLRTVAVGLVVETDVAQTVTRILLGVIGQAVETDTSQLLSSVKAKVLGQVIETDQAFTVRLPSQITGGFVAAQQGSTGTVHRESSALAAGQGGSYWGMSVGQGGASGGMSEGQSR